MDLPTLLNEYHYAVVDRADPRTSNWPLVNSPFVPLSVVACYVLLCWNAKRLTAPLPVLQLRSLIVAYNGFMLLLSAYMMYEFFAAAYQSNFGVLCVPVDYSEAESAIRMASVCWVYYISKYIELIETFIFALRKKFNQISFLHVYHHSSMIFIWWMGSKYVPGGQSYIFGGINSFVHFVMYTYYGLSAMGPHMQKYLWWKRYLTMLQLSQFVVLFFYCIGSILTDCNYAKWLCNLMIGYAISLLILFGNFYVLAYLNKPTNTTVTKVKKHQ
uniref:Elongation of very long chain fatty acids protein n=1 Tax=Ciona savignyi TaxID=51511 RepID=H2ZDU1_CIOSA